VGSVGRQDPSDDRVFITIRHENGSVSNISYQCGGDPGSAGERIEIHGGGRTGIIENWDRVELWENGRARRFGAGKDKGHSREIQTFLEACRKGGPWPIPWDHLYGVSWASLGAVESLRQGLPLVRAAEES